MDINMNAVNKYAVHPASVGAAAALITLAAVGNEGSIKIGSMMVSPAVAIGLSAATADLVGQAVGAYLLTLPQANKYGNAEKKLLAPVLVGASLIGTVQLYVGPPIGFESYMKVFALGAMSEMAGSYTANLLKGVM
jgi:hypothetical protein